MGEPTSDGSIESVLRNDLVIVDEVGVAPLDSTGSQLLFRFVATDGASYRM